MRHEWSICLISFRNDTVMKVFVINWQSLITPKLLSTALLTKCSPIRQLISPRLLSTVKYVREMMCSSCHSIWKAFSMESIKRPHPKPAISSCLWCWSLGPNEYFEVYWRLGEMISLLLNMHTAFSWWENYKEKLSTMEILMFLPKGIAAGFLLIKLVNFGNSRAQKSQ